ncbi:HpcH/HpaI aldolase/citrate lyase domain [Trypanosoma melophagium]|uniref:HpcH/HpaI aldolase/citrate lyase domain n=1 Tax=Trypanosoma melophagium TaxID=715481 RepID=UPI00351A6795|nr:HpcH/HpaI aldolase/citrate lyase domain [Trypanosoma melophagium]KAH9599523.1 HpcH/HpaI aldolase/citrate lyase domain [Trypanosoma melophagium]
MSAGGAEFRAELRAGKPKFGVHSGHGWLLLDTQHAPVDAVALSQTTAAIRTGPATIMVRVGSTQDRPGIQNALDSGGDGVLIPHVNNAAELEAAVSCCYYPTAGTRSVYTPQQCMNAKGLLGYAGEANKNVVAAFQVETADCIKNIDAIMAVKGVDIAFLG